MARQKRFRQVMHAHKELPIFMGSTPFFVFHNEFYRQYEFIYYRIYL